ncbi:MAG: cation transporter, partial [Ectothiorhodospiraceae bacterium]
MSGCCGGDDCEIRAGNPGQARMLWIVFAINAGMFLVEFGAGWVASSTALLGDSLDMLGDALVYAVSLLAVSRGPGWKAGSATFKGLIM